MNSMTQGQQSRLKRPATWSYLIPIIAGLCLMHQVGIWAWAFFHDRIIITNKSAEPITKLEVFFDKPWRSLTFDNVPVNGRQWKPCDRRWGASDSVRLIKVEGTTPSGKRIGSKDWFAAGITSTLRPLIGGSYVAITVQSDGSISSDHN